MDLAHFSMLIHEFLNEYPDIVSEEAPLIILDGKSSVCMANNDKDTNKTWNIDRRSHLVRNGENCKMHKITWCEGGIQLVDIPTRNVGENDLIHRMQYIMASIDN